MLILLRNKYYSSPVVMDEDEYLEQRTFGKGSVRIVKNIANKMSAELGLANVIQEGLAKVKANQLDNGALHGWIRKQLPGLKMNKKDLNRQISAVQDSGFFNVRSANRVNVRRSTENVEGSLNKLFEGANDKEAAEKIRKAAEKNTTGRESSLRAVTRAQKLNKQTYNPSERAVLDDNFSEIARDEMGGQGSRSSYYEKLIGRRKKREAAGFDLDRKRGLTPEEAANNMRDRIQRRFVEQKAAGKKFGKDYGQKHDDYYRKRDDSREMLNDQAERISEEAMIKKEAEKVAREKSRAKRIAQEKEAAGYNTGGSTGGSTGGNGNTNTGESRKILPRWALGTAGVGLPVAGGYIAYKHYKDNK